nr:ribonuclease H-like domain-containing protein [Tanacetum cinerariifolium]
MKLNQKKCSFGVEEGKFLGYMVTSKGIRANPKKMKAIADMQSFKDSERNEKLKRKTEDAERAFQEMKKLIIELPTLTTLTPKETLFVYLDTSKDVVSEVLMADRKEKKTLFCTTNKAEYQALLAGLRIAHKMKVQALKVNVDSKLVACQLNDEFEESSEGMKPDVLSKLASVAFNYLTKNVLVEFPNAKSVDAQEINAIVEEEEDNWMALIIKCLEEGVWLRRERS